MEQSQMLTQLTERAIESGWNQIHGDRWFKVYTNRGGYTIEFRREVYAPGSYVSLNDLLFGDNLSFLKALVGDKVTPFVWEKGQATGQGPMHEIVALEIVLLPDTERIPWLHKTVFGEEE